MVGRRTSPGTWARIHMMSECGGPASTTAGKMCTARRALLSAQKLIKIQARAKCAAPCTKFLQRHPGSAP
jgi:hypothetical protein